MFPRSEVFFLRKTLVFRSPEVIKQQQQLANLTNPAILCSYYSSFIYLTVALVDFLVEVRPSLLDHICQGGLLFLVPGGTYFHLELSHAVHTGLRKD